MRARLFLDLELAAAVLLSLLVGWRRFNRGLSHLVRRGLSQQKIESLITASRLLAHQEFGCGRGEHVFITLRVCVPLFRPTHCAVEFRFWRLVKLLGRLKLLETIRSRRRPVVERRQRFA